MVKPYASSCDENCNPIGSVLQHYLTNIQTVFEIGSGTGQHAVFFANQFPHLTWYTSDQIQYHEGINLWLADAPANNIVPPIELNVNQTHWPNQLFDVVFSANTAHIMSWDSVQSMLKGVGNILPKGGLFILYGPFNYNNQYTSESNRQFDGWLKQRDPQSAIRNFEDLQQLAEQSGMQLVKDHEMPANNRILVWKKMSIG